MQLHSVKGAEPLIGGWCRSRSSPDLYNGTTTFSFQEHTKDLSISRYKHPIAHTDGVACALVNGGRLSDVTAKTVTKQAKEKAFAAGCDWNRIVLIEPILSLPKFYSLAIGGLMAIREDLGLS